MSDVKFISSPDVLSYDVEACNLQKFVPKLIWTGFDFPVHLWTKLTSLDIIGLNWTIKIDVSSN